MTGMLVLGLAIAWGSGVFEAAGHDHDHGAWHGHDHDHGHGHDHGSEPLVGPFQGPPAADS